MNSAEGNRHKEAMLAEIVHWYFGKAEMVLLSNGSRFRLGPLHMLTPKYKTTVLTQTVYKDKGCSGGRADTLRFLIDTLSDDDATALYVLFRFEKPFEEVE